MTAVVGLVVVLPLLSAAVVLGFRHRATVRDVVTLSSLAATHRPVGRAARRRRSRRHRRAARRRLGARSSASCSSPTCSPP